MKDSFIIGNPRGGHGKKETKPKRFLPVNPPLNWERSDGALLSRSKNGFSLATAVQSWLLDQYFTCATGRVGVRSSVHSLGNRRVIQALVPGFFFQTPMYIFLV